jgi:hypothetical protein
LISLSGDLVFSQQQGIYGLKFTKRFLEISSRDLTLFSILIILRPDYQFIDTLPLCIRKAECLASSSQTFSQFIRPKSLLSYTQKSKLTALKKFIEALKRKGMNAMPALFEVLSAVANLSFGKYYKSGNS